MLNEALYEIIAQKKKLTTMIYQAIFSEILVLTISVIIDIIDWIYRNQNICQIPSQRVIEYEWKSLSVWSYSDKFKQTFTLEKKNFCTIRWQKEKSWCL